MDPRYAGCLPAAASPIPFFLRQLCGSPGLSKPVWYYVMGGGRSSSRKGGHWRNAANWPPPSTPTQFFFGADGSLKRTAAHTVDALSFQYDPSNPVPTLGGRNLRLLAGPCDQRPVESRGDVLLFTSDTLDEAVEVTGKVEATLFVSSDCPDTDFTVKLTDVYPDGRSMLVCDGIVRTRFRHSFETPKLMEPGDVYELRVDLWSTATVFDRGHRIRVAVSSSNAPRFEPNPNTGEPLAPSSSPRVATNTVHVSAKHRSSILLPIFRDGE
jgi:putative CocE/NonD family hydrolase